jgi:hypothetical protein
MGAHQLTQHQQVHPRRGQLGRIGAPQAVRSHRRGTKADPMDAERVRERLDTEIIGITFVSSSASFGDLGDWNAVTQCYLPPIRAATRSLASLDVSIRPSVAGLVLPDLLVDACGVQPLYQFGATAPPTALFDCAAGTTGCRVVLHARISRAGPPGCRCTPGSRPQLYKLWSFLDLRTRFVTFASTRLGTRSRAWARSTARGGGSDEVPCGRRNFSDEQTPWCRN